MYFLYSNCLIVIMSVNLVITHKISLLQNIHNFNNTINASHIHIIKNTHISTPTELKKHIITLHVTVPKTRFKYRHIQSLKKLFSFSQQQSLLNSSHTRTQTFCSNVLKQRLPCTTTTIVCKRILIATHSHISYLQNG